MSAVLGTFPRSKARRKLETPGHSSTDQADSDMKGADSGGEQDESADSADSAASGPVCLHHPSFYLGMRVPPHPPRFGCTVAYLRVWAQRRPRDTRHPSTDESH